MAISENVGRHVQSTWARVMWDVFITRTWREGEERQAALLKADGAQPAEFGAGPLSEKKKKHVRGCWLQGTVSSRRMGFFQLHRARSMGTI